ncbi:MAG: hypothetical protein MZV70_57315 [Desulfobacterales bacterium]|nr:hypothetical protein [Desulfobacterales bacterium]
MNWWKARGKDVSLALAGLEGCEGYTLPDYSEFCQLAGCLSQEGYSLSAHQVLLLEQVLLLP